jgi:RHS repeat-associated protein
VETGRTKSRQVKIDWYNPNMEQDFPCTYNLADFPGLVLDCQTFIIGRKFVELCPCPRWEETEIATSFFEPDVLTATDYYPFGMEMPGRKYNPQGYRYGFNGKENDRSGEWGLGLVQDYGFRLYNPGLGRFLSVDPLTTSFPWNSTYAFAENRPIDGIDLEGGEFLRVSSKMEELWSVFESIVKKDPILENTFIKALTDKKLKDKIVLVLAVGDVAIDADATTNKVGSRYGDTDIDANLDWYISVNGREYKKTEQYKKSDDLRTNRANQVIASMEDIFGSLEQAKISRDEIKSGKKTYVIVRMMKGVDYNNIIDLAHELYFHVFKLLKIDNQEDKSGDCGGIDDHKWGYGEDWYKNHSCNSRPDNDQIDPKSKFGQIKKRIDKVLEENIDLNLQVK